MSPDDATAAVPATAPRPGDATLSAGPVHRWRLHRGGIVNIWQYAEHTFDLSGGRAIFQGTNGSGKSRTLELLLPLCLDGDLRQLGSKGFDTVSIRRLMLDEYPGGPNRIGYAWVELRRESPDGGEEFLTCGVGVKASKTSQAVSDSWRFVTSRRVGINLHLVGPERVPLGPAQLRDLLGADCVLDDQGFRAKVAAQVYGVPAARYGDLLHLQRTLRNPDVGLKVLEGQLEQILSDALPPLEPALIERLASSFDDLESIRENIVRLTGADKALGAFLSTYSGYALGALRERAESMRSAQDRLAVLRKELAKLDRQVAAHREERDTAQRTVAELEQREGTLESSIEALRSHPAYAELQNLRDRERVVEGARSAAVAALETAARHRAQEERSAESVLGTLRRLVGDAESAEQAAQRANRQLAAAGLDGNLVPRPPEVPKAEPISVPERVRAAPEPDAELLEVDRRSAPEVDTDDLARRFRTVADRSAQARAEAQRRGAWTLTLHQQAVELDRQREQVGKLQQQARQAQLIATESVGRRNQAQQRLQEAAADWRNRAQHWGSEHPESIVDDPVPEPPAQERLLADRSAARAAQERARQWARPRLQEARQRISAVERELGEVRAQVRTGEQELAELRSGVERTPARPDWAVAERAEQDGRAFYRLVDFQPSLDAAQRAGLEAALQASGLLNAWVSARGTVAGFEDVLAVPGEAGSAGTLAELLVPAPEPGCPVPAEQVAALLASVSTVDAAGLSVDTSGRWRAGVLSGAWHKESAEYVGAGAREQSRARRIAELEEQLAALREQIGDVEKRHREATEHGDALERHLESFPDDADLVTAHAQVATATDAAEDADRHAKQARGELDETDQRWQATRAELVRAAGEADLPPETQALEQANRAATEARTAIDALHEVLESRCLATLADLRDIALHHDAAVADRMEAESQAEQRCAEHTEQAAGLTELNDAVGGQAQEISGKVGELERERARLREDLPAARERISTAREQVVRLETQQETKHAQLAGRESDAEAASTAFTAALRVPGAWAAAEVVPAEDDGDRNAEPPADPAEAAELLAAAGDRKTAGETAVLNRFQALQQSLSGGYDITAGDQQGLLTVTVTGEEGPQPVADAARRVAERLAEQRGFLNERYRSIFADYLIRDLAERLRGQVTVAEELCKRMNEVLDGARSSQGVHVQLEWEPAPSLGDDIKQAVDLVRTPFADRSDDQDSLLRKVFTDLIEAERDSASGGYAEILSRALDYRSWFAFTVRVRDTGPEGKPRVRRLRQLSSGETRLISYVTLFAAAAAFYDAVSVSSGGRGPLRLVLLDEAFERLDDPTIARMLGLLVDLDMDWLITWPSGWGVSPKIPKMHIYDVLRPRSGHGIACTHTTWDGRDMERTDG